MTADRSSQHCHGVTSTVLCLFLMRVSGYLDLGLLLHGLVLELSVLLKPAVASTVLPVLLPYEVC